MDNEATLELAQPSPGQVHSEIDFWAKQLGISREKLVEVVRKVGPMISAEDPPTARPVRPFGSCAGEFVVPGDFDAPLPEDLQRAFEGE